MTDPLYHSYCTFSITSASCFPKEYYSNRGISPVCAAFSEPRLMLNDCCCCTEGADQARHRMPLLFFALRANPVSSSKQQCMEVLRLAYSISEDFPLLFIWLFMFYPSFPSLYILPLFFTLEQPDIPPTNILLLTACHINP